MEQEEAKENGPFFNRDPPLLCFFGSLSLAFFFFFGGEFVAPSFEVPPSAGDLPLSCPVRPESRAFRLVVGFSFDGGSGINGSDREIVTELAAMWAGVALSFLLWGIVVEIN
jgi:hypothetical protein